MSDGGFSTDGGEVLNPDGTVSYDFQGHVSAQGLDLPATVDNSAPNNNKIRWIKQADGSLVAFLTAYDNGITSFTGLESDHGAAYSGIAIQSGGAPSQAYAYAHSALGVHKSVKIIDDAGASDFLQVGAAKCSGTALVNVTWYGGGGLSGPTSFVHNYGTQALVVAQVQDFSPVGEVKVLLKSFANQIDVYGHCASSVPAAGVQVSIGLIFRQL
jgi:hypothetical protein